MASSGENADEAAAAQEARDKEVADWVEEGHQAVNKHSLKEAENILHKAWSGLRSDAPDADQLLIRSLLALAEVYYKRGRSSKDEMESYWQFLKSVTLQKITVEICENAMEQRVSNNIYQWLVERRDGTTDKLNALEMHLTKLIYNRLMNFKQDKEKEQEEDGDCETEQWLSKLVNHCKQRLKDLYDKDDLTDPDGEEEETDSSASDKDESESEQKAEETEGQKKIEFEKLQSTIQSLIRKMTFESKQQNLQDLKKEIANRDASVEEEEEDKYEQEESRLLKSIILHRVKPPVVPEVRDHDKKSGGDRSSEKKDDKLSKKEKAPHRKKKNVSFVPPTQATKPTELVPPSYRNEFQQTQHERSVSPNILRIWKGYKSANITNMLPKWTPYKLHTFEELSPITEAFRFKTQNEKSTEFNEVKSEQVSPITEANFNCSLADVFARVAEKMLNEKKFKDSLKIYTLSLGIYQTIPEETSCMVKMAHIIKHIGIVRCRLGDVVSGCQLMEKSIDIFEKYPHSNATHNVAKVWYELGVAYMSDQWTSETLFDHVTDAIHSELDDMHMFRNEYQEYSETDSEGDSENSEESYSVCTKEAITCYTHAYDLLNKLRAHGNRQHSDLYAEVLTKLGDCSVMVGNYDQAVKSYEEAMRHFRVTFGSTNLVENAHVLSMMGVANFLLKHYPQAASILKCAYLMQHHMFSSVEEANFEVAFTLTMLAITYYMMGQYHLCIQWCIKAYNIYLCMFGENMVVVEEKKRWFIILTLFVLGFSYGTLNFYDKAITQLMLAREICLNAEVLDRRQIVRIVKSLADVYSGMEDNDNALIYYNEALEYNIGYDEEDAAVLQNQLLNRTAGVHVNMKQYSAAAKYLEQALDVQKNLEDDIKGDLVTVLHQLGQTYALAGDIDKAIECYMECLEDYKEEHGSLTAVMCPTLANLANLCHVKGCLEDGEDGLKMLEMAESYYKESLKMDNSANVSTLYANYLYCQGNYGEALDVLLPVLHKELTDNITEIAFTGVELAILPEHIQIEIDELEEVFFDCNVLSKFLAILCYKQLNLVKDADDCLVRLYNVVQTQSSPLAHSMLGYVLMEMGMLLEASKSFYKASVLLENHKSSAYVNCWICVCMHMYVTMVKCLCKFLELANVTALPQLQYQDRNQQDESSGHGTRDSGYYENKEMDMWTSTETVATVTSQPLESDYLTQEEDTEMVTSWDKRKTIGKPTVPKVLPLVHKTTDDKENHKPFQNWEETRSLPYSIDSLSQEFDTSWELSSTDTLETPDIILKSLSDQNYIRNLTNMSFLDGDEGLLTPSTTDDEWTITEETVETPAILLSALRNSEDGIRNDGSKRVSGDGLVTVVQAVNKPIVWTSSMPEDKSNQQEATEEPDDSSIEEWTVFEETVETPSVILHQLQNKQVESVHVASDDNNGVADQLEEWVTEEVVRTPSAIPQALSSSQTLGSHGDGVAMDTNYDDMKGNDQNDMHEWTVTEEVVETPLEFLLALTNRDSNEISRDQPTEETETEQEWTVFEEETVETPSFVLQAMTNQSNECYSPIHLYDENQATQTYHEQSKTPERDDPEEVWTVTEEVVEMPAYVLEALIRNGVETYAKTDLQTEEEEVVVEEWVTTEEVVETPAYLLQSVTNTKTSQQQRENNTDTQNKADTQESEEWVVTEEVVETPSTVLMEKDLSNQSRQIENNIDTQNEADTQESEEWVVTEEVVETPSTVLRAMMEKDLRNQSRQTAQHSSSSSSGHSNLTNGHSQEFKPYQRHDLDMPHDNKTTSYRNDTTQEGEQESESDEEVVITEELVVETPSFLLQALMKQADEQRQLAPAPSPYEGQVTQKNVSHVSDDAREGRDGEEPQGGGADEWTMEEITVETPAVLLQSLQNSVSDSQHVDSVHSKGGRGVHVTNTTLSLPSSKSSMLRHSATNSGSRFAGKNNENEADIYKGFDKSDDERSNSSYRHVSSNLNNDSKTESSTAWTTEEVVMETPSEILETIKNNNNSRVTYTDNGHKTWQSTSTQDRTAGTTDADEENQDTWVTTEEVVSTPVSVLQTLKQDRGDTAMNVSSSSDMHTSSSETSPDDEDVSQVWQTEEIVVETPAIILALLAKCKS